MSFSSRFFVLPLPFLTLPLIACGVGGDWFAPNKAALWPCEPVLNVFLSSTLYTAPERFLNFNTNKITKTISIIVPAMMPIMKAVFSAASEDIRSLSLIGIIGDGCGGGGGGGGRYWVVVVGIVDSTTVVVVEEDSAENEGELGIDELPELLDMGTIGESDVAPPSTIVLEPDESITPGTVPDGNTVWPVWLVWLAEPVVEPFKKKRKEN